MKSFLHNKTILVTGGTGTIGNALLRQSLKHNPREIHIFSRDEMKQYDMATEFEDEKKIKFIIGDVTNAQAIEKACRNVDIVFHSAALKQVPITEKFPSEAINTNVLGTANVIRASILNEVNSLVNISTDKAVEPTSVLGATKLLAEKLITTASQENKRPIFCNVRFGNVLGSRGSLIPKIEKQILLGKKVTITNPYMTRFIMSINEAAELVIFAASMAKGGETFVLKMKSVTIEEFVKGIIEYISKSNNIPLKNIKTKTIGKRLGEKMHEKLIGVEEQDYAIEKNRFLIIKQVRQNSRKKINSNLLSSESSPRIPFHELRKLIESHYK